MISLKGQKDRRVRKGHLWIFSNEIESPPVSSLEPGSIHELTDHAGEFMGMVYVNPASLITARLLSTRRRDIDADFIHERISSALGRRTTLYRDRDHYRLVYSESDLLPGLVVDRYGDTLVVQSLTAGMDSMLEWVQEALVDLLEPQGIYLRNDSQFRTLEGLPLEKRILYGSVPDKVEISSRGLRILVDVVNGQKTGFFLDQESNRDAIERYIPPGARILDLFSYSAAWALRGLASGAESAIAVDSSRGALDMAMANAGLNDVAGRLAVVKQPVVDYLKKCREKFDLVVLDPPAFIKSRSQVKDGRKGYIDVNRRAMMRIDSGGILVTCSCSHHLDLEDFMAVIQSASTQSGRQLRILEVRGQGPDHPVLLSMPETRYLKVVIAQVV